MAVIILSCVCGLGRAGSAAPASTAEEDIFHSTHLLRISIEIPEQEMSVLRRYRWNQQRVNHSNRPKVLAEVMEGGRRYTNVTVQLKGSFGSFRPLDDRPSLTLNFSKEAEGQRFHCLKKISLNNAVQDPTCINEKLARELFAAAGVPVPRADHAVVSLNGRELGLYLLIEGYNKDFLKRYFKRPDGNLYEASYYRDINQPLELISGNQPADDPLLERLLEAVNEPDSEKRFHAIEQVLDLDRYFSMMAMEVILCHWDSYSINHNNYRIYHDPETDRLVFMPHGMDQILGNRRRNLNLSTLPRMNGMVSEALVSTRFGWQPYLKRLEVLFNKIFQPEKLCQRVHEIDRKIAAELQHPETRWAVRGENSNAPIKTSGDHAQDIEELCERIRTRAEYLRKQFEGEP